MADTDLKKADAKAQDSGTSFSVNLVASDHPVWSGQVTYAVIPDEMGRLGFLPHHEPVLTSLQAGVVRLVDLENKNHLFTIDGGFAAFDNNQLTIAVLHCSGEQKFEDVKVGAAAASQSADTSADTAHTADTSDTPDTVKSA
jgi:F-type H+-transporting ATPase subunit epsilon